MTTFLTRRTQIQCGLSEDVQSEHMHFLGDASTAPATAPISNGVFSDGDAYFHIKPDGTRMSLRNENSAEMFSEVLRRSHNKQLHSIDAMMNDHYSGVYQHPEYANAISKYTDVSTKLNDRMSSGVMGDADKKLISNLSMATSHTKTPDNLVVYSGMSAGHSSVIRTKDVVDHPTFLSTSTSINAASDFASKGNGDIVQIHVPVGHAGVWAHPLSKHHEHEFILPSGVSLKIHRDKEKVLITPSKRFRVHYATIES